MTRVLITWADPYSPNLGVRALAHGMAEIAELAWGPGAEVEFQNFAAAAGAPAFGGRSILADALTRRTVTPRLRDFDVVLDSGAGDSFTDIYGVTRLATMSYVHGRAKRLKVATVFGPQTLGPFRSRIGRMLARQSLAGLSAVIARDSESVAYSRDVLHFQSAQLSTDVVFSLPPPAGPSRPQSDVILNVSGLLWRRNGHVDHSFYRAAVRSQIISLIAQGRHVTLLAHVIDNPTSDNDVPAVEDAAAEFANDVEVFIPASLWEARSIISGANLLIGARMHACLNALSLGVPAIPWAYSRKFAPLMSDIGWRYSKPLGAVSSPELIAATDYALSNLDALRAESVSTRDRAKDALRRTVEILRSTTL